MGEITMIICGKCWLKHINMWFDKDYSENNKTFIGILK